jgi:hypothetical protein
VRKEINIPKQVHGSAQSQRDEPQIPERTKKRFTQVSANPKRLELAV